MKVEIIRPGQTEFASLRIGSLFFAGSGIYIKSADTIATSVYKVAGHMNAGEQESFKGSELVQRVAQVSFTLG